MEESMSKLFEIIGNVAAALGVLVCVVAGVARLTSAWHLVGFQTQTWFIVGIALMVFACLSKLHSLPNK
jgi:type IV secretory pathway VirB2 component (pilin)